MSKYKVGDYVIVNGHHDGLRFQNDRGRIHCLYPITGAGYDSLFGIDFSGDKAALEKHGFNLHDLDARLPDSNGYWISSHLFKLTERQKTGFGRFISRIEA